jgi:hypothetical protein
MQSLFIRRLSSAAAAAKPIEWSSISAKATSPAAKGEVARLSQLFSELESTSKNVAKEIAPIDFSQYSKSIKSAGVVAEFEKAYKALQLPNYIDQSAASADAKLAEVTKIAAEAVQKSSGRVAALEKILGDLYSKRTTKQTTIDEVLALYPEIKAEIAEETKNHEWSKGIA